MCVGPTADSPLSQKYHFLPQFQKKNDVAASLVWAFLPPTGWQSMALFGRPDLLKCQLTTVLSVISLFV